MDTLEQRIAAALSEDASASDLEALVTEVQSAAAAAEEAAVEARNHALDPTVTDPSARTALTDAEFTRDRLQTALPQLQARLGEVGAAERYRTWAAEYDEVAAEQTALAQELTELYPPFERAIVDLLLRIEKIDNRASHLDYYKPQRVDGQPYDDNRWSQRTEQMARSGGGLSIMKDMKLPAWAGNIVPVWPPWRPLGAQVAAMYALPAPAVTPEQIAGRDAALKEEAERVAAFYFNQERRREEREAAEAHAAQERDIERRRQAGWGW
jgi:hypothetical protein